MASRASNIQYNRRVGRLVPSGTRTGVDQPGFAPLVVAIALVNVAENMGFRIASVKKTKLAAGLTHQDCCVVNRSLVESF